MRCIELRKLAVAFIATMLFVAGASTARAVENEDAVAGHCQTNENWSEKPRNP